MQNPITAVKQKIEDHRTLLAFIAGVTTTTVATAILAKKLPIKPFHHEIFPPQTAAEISAILEKAKAIDINCPHGVVTLFGSDYAE